MSKAILLHPMESSVILDVIHKLYEIEKALGHVEDAAHYLELYEALTRRLSE